MTLRKGEERLQRPCEKCGKYFVPTGRANWICPECNPQGKWLNKILKLSKKVDKKQELSSNAKKIIAKKKSN